MRKMPIRSSQKRPFFTLFMSVAKTIVFLLIMSHGTGWTQWSTDPTINTTICTVSGTNEYLATWNSPRYYIYASISDGEGGAIITWYNHLSSALDIYAQRINASGIILWGDNGIPVCTASNSQSNPTMASDGNGGALITWIDGRGAGWDIYAQRVNASGVVQWTGNGVAICIAENNQEYPTIVSDDKGGAIITWHDNRSGNWDIYAQRVNVSGVIQWPLEGVALCTSPNTQWYPMIISDGNGGAIIAWADERSGDWDIYSQRLSSSGEIQWIADGVAVCTAINHQSGYSLVPDGSGGAIITWQDWRSKYYVNPHYDYNIYAQHIDSAGDIQWVDNGVAICTVQNEQENPVIVSDGSGGAIITWHDYRLGSYNYDIYAQRVNALGEIQWTDDGVPICTAGNQQQFPAIVPDGSGGAIITWKDGHLEWLQYDIYAQRVNVSGEVKWTINGVAICTAVNDQECPTIVLADNDGAIVSWIDLRSENRDIYAQRVCSDGCIGNDEYADIDQDGMCGNVDNCPCIYNPDQEDSDGDGMGNACDSLRGDVDGNCSINILDVLRVVNMILQEHTPTMYEEATGDCNKDGGINIVDVLGIVNVILGISECGP